MTDAVAVPVEPDGAPRLLSLDVLRGIAILGILFMNINDMGGPLAGGFTNDPRLLGWSRADQVAWWLREVLANGTARCLLEMLFGCGMVILTDRAATRLEGEWPLLRAYAARNVILFGFGLVHLLVLLWPGDILHTYAIAALVAVLFRRAKPRLMLTLGLAGAVFQLLAGGAYVMATQRADAAGQVLVARAAAGASLAPAERTALVDHRAAMAERALDRAEVRALVRREDVARSGAPRGWVVGAWRAELHLQVHFVEIIAVWEAAGTMLIGAALFRWGVLQGERRPRFYLVLTFVGYALGLSLRAWEAWVTTRFAHLVSLAYPAGEVARLATTLGHVGLINLLLATAVGAAALRPFAAAGRTALTVYIAQTLVCLWVLYPPWGLALYGQQGWAALMATAFAVDAALLLGANLWVRRYSISPVEWAWRSILVQRPLPMRRVVHLDREM